MKMHEALFGSAASDSNYDMEDTRAWAKFLTRKGGEYKSGGMHKMRAQKETLTKAKGESNVDNVVSSYTEIVWMVVKHVGCKTEQLVTKEIPAWLQI